MQELATRTATAMTIANRNGNADVGDDSDNRNHNGDGGVGDSDDDDDEGRKMEACNHAMSFYINGSMRCAPPPAMQALQKTVQRASCAQFLWQASANRFSLAI